MSPPFISSALSREFSENALGLLGQTDFKEGIVAGVAKDIPVSHKYGERGVYEGGDLIAVELHDCGIVYHPKHSYIICVMTKTHDIKFSEEIIKRISEIVYAEVSTL